MDEMFQKMIALSDLRNARIPASKNKSTIKYGITKIVFKGLQIWQKMLLEIRNSGSRNHLVFSN